MTFETAGGREVRLSPLLGRMAPPSGRMSDDDRKGIEVTEGNDKNREGQGSGQGQGFGQSQGGKDTDQSRGGQGGQAGQGSGQSGGGGWDELKGKAKRAWGNLTDDDLDVAEGNYDELVGKIKNKTGESDEAIRTRLDKN